MNKSDFNSKLDKNIYELILDLAETDDWQFRAELLNKRTLFLDNLTRDIKLLIKSLCMEVIGDDDDKFEHALINGFSAEDMYRNELREEQSTKLNDLLEDSWLEK